MMKNGFKWLIVILSALAPFGFLFLLSNLAMFQYWGGSFVALSLVIGYEMSILLFNYGNRFELSPFVFLSYKRDYLVHVIWILNMLFLGFASFYIEQEFELNSALPGLLFGVITSVLIIRIWGSEELKRKWDPFRR